MREEDSSLLRSLSRSHPDRSLLRGLPYSPRHGHCCIDSAVFFLFPVTMLDSPPMLFGKRSAPSPHNSTAEHYRKKSVISEDTTMKPKQEKHTATFSSFIHSFTFTQGGIISLSNISLLLPLLSYSFPPSFCRPRLRLFFCCSDYASSFFFFLLRRISYAHHPSRSVSIDCSSPHEGKRKETSSSSSSRPR